MVSPREKEFSGSQETLNLHIVKVGGEGQVKSSPPRSPLLQQVKITRVGWGTLFEEIRDAVPPDHPDLTARRCLREHLIGAVLPFLKAKYAVERCLDLFSREGVGVNLLKISFDPIELPHALAPSRPGSLAGQFTG